MELTFTTRLRQAWNAFLNNKDPTMPEYRDVGPSYSIRPDRPRLNPGNERSIITSVFNRIAMDVAAVKIRHVRFNEDEQYIGEVNSALNNCLKLEANVDQTARAFIQDIVMSMLDEGTVAIVPIDTSVDPRTNNSFEIHTMRTAKIIEWHPQHVKVRVYNDRSGQKEDLLLPKTSVGIIENPLYAVINERNSVLQRLVRKLNLLDVIDEQSSSGKLDLIIQLPYTTRTEARKKQAEERKKDIEVQLAGSKYGVAYTDASEKIIQLNRSLDNNLQPQIDKLEKQLEDQLGIGEEILNGKATEQQLLNYTNNIIEPIVSVVVNECKRKFLTKNARSRGETIMYFRDPFKLVPVNNIADIADKLRRNEILSSNEIRGIIGFEPVDDEKADMLVNPNINQSNAEIDAETGDDYGQYEDGG